MKIWKHVLTLMLAGAGHPSGSEPETRALVVHLDRTLSHSTFLCALLLALIQWVVPVRAALLSGEVHMWEVQEITFQTAVSYANPYAEVDCWIELEGPGFARRVFGFWDGGRTFKIRWVATAPGEWRWRSGSNQPGDAGLNGGSGKLKAVDWSDAEKLENPNRRGFVRASANGHALRYADGTPFFLLGDTWLAASTWRLPWRGAPATPDYVPQSGISFEEAVAYRKRHGFNSVSFIAAFPNWDADSRPATFANADGIYLRNAWEKFGHWPPNATVSTGDGTTTTAKDMADEHGQRPFDVFADRDGLANFDRINPSYFRSLDRKMRHLSEEGFVPFLETVRRDNCPSWKAYFDFNTSYARFVQYLVARYSAFNLVFSGIHLDWIPKDYTGWNNSINRPGGETPPANSDRDNYFARAMMYGSVLSGGLAGHVHGTAAYDITSTGEPAGWRPHIWTALRYESGAQMQHLGKFILSEGARYQQLAPASADLQPRAASSAASDGLDGWSFMLRTAERDFALLYFEHKAALPKLSGLTPAARYRWTWFNPRNGHWNEPFDLVASADGTLAAPVFPTSDPAIISDWAAKLMRVP